MIVALLLTLLLSARGGTTTGLIGAAVDQTATAINAQTTDTVEGTSTASATGTAAPRATATPRPNPAVHTVSAQATVKSGTSVVASCPTGELALSGGWKSTTSAPIYNSTRSGNGWRVFPNSATGAPVTAYVMCLQHVAGAAITERSAQITAQPRAFARAFPTCHSGEVPVGGGFANPSPGVQIDVFHYITDPGTGETGIYAEVFNNTSSPQSVTFYAECLSASHAHVAASAPGIFPVGPGASGAITVECPRGVLLTGGGFAFTALKGVVSIFAPSVSGATASAQWQAFVTNQDTQGQNFQLEVVCLSFS